LRLNGKIIQRSKKPLYFKDKDWNKNMNYVGAIESEDCNTFQFKYREIKFSLFNIQIGLKVSFDLITDRSGEEVVQNVEKYPEDYGFLHFHNEKNHKGYFRTFEKDKVGFFDGNVRDEDEPIYDSLYVFDTITTEENKYNNSYYRIGEISDSDNYEVGQIRKGTVKTITSFGGFLDIGHPSNDGLLYCKEIIWSNENVEPNQYLRLGQSIDVLITKIFVKNGDTKIALSAKALIDPPKETKINHKAMNIFRLSKMKTHIISGKVIDIAKRDDILPEVKSYAISVIKNNPEIYKQHRQSTLPKLYKDCKKQLLHHIENLNFDLAFPLLQEYATFDISILELIERFPAPFIESLKSLTVDIDTETASNDLDAFLFSTKNNCSITDARAYLDLSADIFSEHSQNNLDLLRNRMGLQPSIQLDEKDYD
jgi:predicted RNA-binding protein with RPS1 domain